MDREDKNNQRIFLLTSEDLQEVSIDLIGRPLNEHELRIATKCLQEGLSYDIDVIFKTAIEEAIS